MSSIKRPLNHLIGTTIGEQFEIKSVIGHGGMGAVYNAVQTLSERSVAIKILHPHLINDELTKRFKQEAIAISRLKHPNIVTIYHHGQDDEGYLYIAMELIEGCSLRKLLKDKGCLPVDRSLGLMIQMAEALAYAHENKIIHRDIKPGNIMITQVGRRETVKILDFGISKLLDKELVRTVTGAMVGSPAYMSPEQWMQDRQIDGRADIYSLGIVFYVLLTGINPFRSDTTPSCMRAHLSGPPPPSPVEHSQHITDYPGLDHIIMKAMERERAKRYQNAYELADALTDLQMRLIQEGRSIASMSTPRLFLGRIKDAPDASTAHAPAEKKEIGTQKWFPATSKKGDQEADGGRSTVNIRCGSSSNSSPSQTREENQPEQNLTQSMVGRETKIRRSKRFPLLLVLSIGIALAGFILFQLVQSSFVEQPATPPPSPLENHIPVNEATTNTNKQGPREYKTIAEIAHVVQRRLPSREINRRIRMDSAPVVETTTITKRTTTSEAKPSSAHEESAAIQNKPRSEEIILKGEW